MYRLTEEVQLLRIDHGEENPFGHSRNKERGPQDAENIYHFSLLGIPEARAYPALRMTCPAFFSTYAIRWTPATITRPIVRLIRWISLPIHGFHGSMI
jgi:hypothetical protein